MLKFIWRLLKWILILFFSTSILAVIAYRFIPVYITPLMIIRCAEQLSDNKSPVIHHTWKPLDKISKHLPVAVMASEDQKFLKHKGFDVEAIEQAYKENKVRKRRRGGSSITQQTAKNVFLWPKSNFVRKGFEAYFTVLIELFWSKQRIMEVYLNSIEMGPGIYGAEAVAKYHFNKNASQLSRDECALIAATLPNPIRYSSKSPSPYMKKRQRDIKKQMLSIPSFPREGEVYDPKTVSGGIYKK